MPIDTRTDENYEESDRIMTVLCMELEQIASLTGNELEIRHETAVMAVKTILNAFYEVSQSWFTVKAMPRTVLYAVLLDVLKETVDSNPEKWSEQEFWVKLEAKAKHYHEKISKFQRFVGLGDKINLDEWREVMKGD